MNLSVLSALLGTASTVAPFVILYLIPAVIAAELALYGWQWRHIDAARPFCLLMSAIVFWSACHAVSVSSSGLAATLFWAQVQYGGIVLIAPIWLWFALAYGGISTEIVAIYRRWMPLPAALSYAAVLTNDAHHLWWPTVMLDASQPFGSLSITRGLLFWLHFGYSYGCIALGFGLIVRKMFMASPLQQRQAQIIAIGALFPILGNLAHILGLRTRVVDDPTPFLFAASGLVIFYAALRYQFPDLSPVAPGTLLASLPDGLVVVDQYRGHALDESASVALASITHELRTPLTSIIGFADMLGRGIFGDLPDRAHEPLAHVRRNSHTLLRLVNDILNFSKIEAGRFTLELAPVDLPSVIRDVAGAMQPQIQERGLKLSVELAGDMPPAYANRERLEQVLTNLLANAVKFTDQGSITMRASYDGEHVRFSVTDTGIGIPPEQQRLIFQEFQQLENEHQDRYPGTGLGLTISRRLIELMGGTLGVESTVGGGSTFYGDVPAVPETLQEKQQGGAS